MGRNRRGQKKAPSRPETRTVSDDVPSPFASIVLKEKEEKPRPVQPKPKKPSQIVQGYNPSDSFADILYNWEHTGNPYAMPKSSAKTIGGQEKKKSFAEILDAWEGKKTKPSPRKDEKRSEAYRPTKSFADILDSWEGKAPVPQKESATPSKTPKPSIVDEASPTTSLFKEMEEDDEIPPTVSWSVFSGSQNIERPVEKKEEPEEVKAPSPVEKRSVYNASRSFASILSEFESGKAMEKEPEKPKPAVRIEEPSDGPDRLFRKMDDDDEIPSSVSWSVFGGAQNIERKAEDKASEPVKREDSGARHAVHVKPAPSRVFQKEAGRDIGKSFDEILEEKGDLECLRRVRTINELRLMMPQSTIDLHGMTGDEARAALESFVRQSVEAGLEKIAVIHGKGLHSEDGVGVLRDVANEVLTASGCVREMILAKPSHGGSGVTWAILKRKE